MPNEISSRRLSPTAALGILLVALSVFGWGLHYKLSLYQVPSAAAPLGPHAKLLSEKERRTPLVAVDNGTLESNLTSAPFEFSAVWLLALTVAFSLRSQFQAQNLIAAAIVRNRETAASSFFSFRPPPSID
jgi:hypothetical protein